MFHSMGQACQLKGMKLNHKPCPKRVNQSYTYFNHPLSREATWGRRNFRIALV